MIASYAAADRLPVGRDFSDVQRMWMFLFCNAFIPVKKWGGFLFLRLFPDLNYKSSWFQIPFQPLSSLHIFARNISNLFIYLDNIVQVIERIYTISSSVKSYI